VLPDRRREPRYSMALIISVDDTGAVTMNMSSMGVYFVTGQPLAAGQEIQLGVSFKHAMPVRTRVTCSGRIVRVDGRPEGFGVAATYEPIGFEIGAGG
jgi:hypothetical protein